MDTLLDKLHRDHINISRLLDILEEQVQRYGMGETPDYPLVVDILRYMEDYPDTVHHPREDMMFARMREHGVDMEMETILRDLEEQHRDVREKSLNFLEALRGDLSAVAVPREAIERHGIAYLEAQRSHMSMEESRVFPAAKRMLEERDWKDLDRSVNEREDPLFGAVVTRVYQSLYQHLVERFEKAAN